RDPGRRRRGPPRRRPRPAADRRTRDRRLRCSVSCVGSVGRRRAHHARIPATIPPESAMSAADSNNAHQPVPRVPGTDKRALITRISGQDGPYLAELLLDKGYEVHGIVRRSSSFNTDRIDHFYHDPHESGVRLFTHYGDLTDAVALVKLLYELQPDEIYHLGAQSHVRVSF